MNRGWVGPYSMRCGYKDGIWQMSEEHPSQLGRRRWAGGAGGGAGLRVGPVLAPRRQRAVRCMTRLDTAQRETTPLAVAEIGIGGDALRQPRRQRQAPMLSRASFQLGKGDRLAHIVRQPTKKQQHFGPKQKLSGKQH